MENRKKAFFSNQLEILLSNLKKELFLNKSFSTKRFVVVPSRHIKNWIEEAFASDKEYGVCSFVKFIDASQMDSFFLDFFDTEKKLPTIFELSLLIETEIRKSVSLSLPEEKEIIDYLEIDGNFSKKAKRRLKLLSDELAVLFLLYGVFGTKLDFESNDSWQMRIWRKIFSEKWTFPINELEYPRALQDVEIHFFALNFLPKIYCDFLEKLSFCNLYFLSPCMYFWEDVCSKKEKRALENFFSKKIDLNNHEEVETYLEDTNPLLANFGKIQKEFLKNVNFDSFEVFENYSVSYDNWLEKNEFDISLLSALKQDLLHLRNPNIQYIIKKDTSSVEVHEAPNKKREIEILYDFILKELSFVKPIDITVLCSNIKEYEPYIHLVFNSNDEVPYKIFSSETASKSFFAQGLIDLLALAGSPFEVEDMLSLFSNPSFLKKHELAEEDFLTIKEWIQNANIRFGLNSEMEKFGKESNYKSWENGIDRLLDGLIFFHDKDDETALDFSDSSLFDKFLKFFFELKNDIQKIEELKSSSLQQWHDILKDIALKNFSLFENDDLEITAKQSFEEFLKDILRASQNIEGVFDFETIYAELKKAFNKTLSLSKAQCNTIRFHNYSSFPPSKVICAIGLNDDFPEIKVSSSLDLLKDKGYVPSQCDEKKYLFLQSLLLCEKSLYLSYIGISSLDGKKQDPSSFILELLSYIKDAYQISKQMIKIHPLLGFDKTYFSLGPTFSKLNEKAAKKYYLQPDEPRILLSDMHKDIKLEKKALPGIVSLADLRALAANPIKFYYNQVLGIYLEREKEDPGLKDFILSNLDKFLIFKKILKKACFNEPQFEKKQIKSVLDELEKEGKFPVGIMKQIAIDEIVSTAHEFYENYKNLKLQNVKLFDVEFKESNLQIFEHDEKLNMPLIELSIDGQSIKIIGQLPDVSKRGLFSQGDDKFFNLIKLWPDYLIFLKIQKELGLENNILFLKTGREKSFQKFDVDLALEKYLKYYGLCLSHPSPLIKDWAEELLFKNENLEKAIRKSLEKEEFIDPYFKSATSCFDIPKADIIIKNWSPLLKETFNPLLEES